MTNSFIIAYEYAKAVLNVCIEQDSVNQWKSDLKLLSMISQHYLIQSLCYRFMKSETIAEILISVYEDIRSDSINFYIRNFINLISKNNRILLLPVIYTLFNNLYYRYMESVKIEIISAYRLEDEQLQRIIDAITVYLRKKVYAVCHLNKDILSGVIIRIENSIIIDGSVRGRILRLRNVFKC